MYDISKAYEFEKMRLDRHFPVHDGDRTDRELEICKLYSSNIEGVKGLARIVMALVIIVILGVFISYGIFTYGVTQDGVANITSIIAGTLSSIIGFYFGTRAAEGAKEAAETPAKESSSNKPPYITDLSSYSGKNGDELTITGTSFGDKPDGSKLIMGGKPVNTTNWTNTQIKFQIPQDQPKGENAVYVIINGMPSNVLTFSVTS